MTTTSPPEQGQLVQVRSRPWVVNVVKPSSLPTPAMKLPVGSRCTEKKLSRTSSPGGGKMLTVLRKRLRTCTSAFLIVAVDAINFGRTCLPLTSDVVC